MSTTSSTAAATATFNRSALEEVLKKRFFYAPSFQIYGGVGGLYDYGPAGCALQTNILDIWRKHFVLEEDMLEMDGSIMTLADVLKTSGHVDKFTDWMTKDVKTGDIFRADHLIENVLEKRLIDDKQLKAVDSVVVGDDRESVKNEYEGILAKIDNYTGPELGEIIRKHNIKSPETNNDLSEPVEFNLMFETSIGPTGHLKGIDFSLTKTAQGQFLNFKKFLEFNNSKMPFASTSIGRSFRNEISPRSGLLRVREFTMAEIEHYVDPDKKDHARFDEVKDIKLRLLPQSIQEEGKLEPVEMSIGEAVNKKIVDNQTLGYFLARIHLFLLKLGIKYEKLRFRQHMPNEMAHYACDCWDAEIQSSYGWIECVGCADRSAYDLTVHSNRTKEKLVVRESLQTPIVYEKTILEINKKVFGPKFRQKSKIVEEYLVGLNDIELDNLKKALDDGDGKTNVTVGTDGDTYEITSDLVTISRQTISEHVREYTPNVIEPSFGIGRILYSLIEHVFWTREGDEQRSVLSFPPRVAPFKCLLVPLSNNPVFSELVRDISNKLRKLGISIKVDDSSNSIGRRYSRNDELGTPFAITIDFQSVKDGTTTLRERDTTKQIRTETSDILQLLKGLLEEEKTWDEIVSRYGEFIQQEL
ncbi:14098_t:CDS:10 [Entrophospora sp. SA101]|nr:14098_t:CDS:10 [Entrophospora sp. SA101]